MTTVREKIALALDNCGSRASLEELIAGTSDYIGVVKIGLEQFVRFGPAIFDSARKFSSRIFLDLKLHDIPNTVARAVEAACDHEIDYLTVHTQGGYNMMCRAVEAVQAVKARGVPVPRLIGVTVLTSIDEAMLHAQLGVGNSLQEQVAHLARSAVQCGLDGIVCSAADLSVIAHLVPAGKTIVTPGIRPAGADVHDQKRVATPRQAIMDGAMLLVVGRAVTAAKDPPAAARAIFTEIEAIDAQAMV